MIKLDDNLLTELGLASLPPEEKRALLKQVYETLEMRVGTTLARQMTDAQLDEFEGFITRNDEQGALQWLEANFPNYKDVVSQEFEILKGEVRQAAPQILASISAPQQAMPSAPQQPYNDPAAYAPQYQQQAYPQQMPPAQTTPQQYSQQPINPGQFNQQPPVDQSQYGQTA